MKHWIVSFVCHINIVANFAFVKKLDQHRYLHMTEFVTRVKIMDMTISLKNVKDRLRTKKKFCF